MSNYIRMRESVNGNMHKNCGNNKLFKGFIIIIIKDNSIIFNIPKKSLNFFNVVIYSSYINNKTFETP